MDVYSGVPTIVTVWLTVIPKLSILILLLELYLQLDSIENLLTVFNPFLENLVNENDLLKSIEEYSINLELDKLSIIVPRLIYEGIDIYYATNIENMVNGELIIEPQFINYKNDLDQIFSWNVIKGNGSSALNNLLFISSLLSLIIGTVLGLAQSQLKRLLA